MSTTVLALGIALGLVALAGVGAIWVAARRSNRRLARAKDLAERASELEREIGMRESILSSLEEGVALLDGSLGIVYKNGQVEKMLPRFDQFADMPPRLRETLEQVGASRSPRVVEIEDAGGRVVRATVVPVRGDGHVLLVLRDVTTARRLEAIRRDFVANASHELKTPAAAVQALAETIHHAAAEDPRAIAKFSDQLSREAERLSRIITDLLDLSRLESEAGESTELRLDLLVAEEADRLRARAEEAGLALAVDTDGRVPVRGSPRDLSLLARNLIENAVQYTRPGGRVEVTVSSQNGTAVLEVKDTGVGIPSRDQARVFERFYRVDRARSRETGGTGLGLSIVRHVVENHGGAVSVQSQLGRGSTFTVRLPLAEASAS